MINCFLSTGWEKKKASREVGIFSKITKKMFQSGPLSPLGRWTGNIYLFKGGLSLRLCHSFQAMEFPLRIVS